MMDRRSPTASYAVWLLCVSRRCDFNSLEIAYVERSVDPDITQHAITESRAEPTRAFLSNLTCRDVRTVMCARRCAPVILGGKINAHCSWRDSRRDHVGRCHACLGCPSSSADDSAEPDAAFDHGVGDLFYRHALDLSPFVHQRERFSERAGCLHRHHALCLIDGEAVL